MTATTRPTPVHGASAGAATERAAGIYLHIPFCATKCHYCDFNAYAGIDDLIPDFVAALARQIETEAAAFDRTGRQLVSVFFGGGTPSLLSGQQVATILAAVARHWQLPPDAEITLEANPGTIVGSRLRDFRAAGINRLSLGAQTLVPRGLAALGREHTADDVRHGVRAARAAGFENVNLDFIYGWDGQTMDDWQSDLTAIAQLDLEHLSLYPLTVEEQTPLAAMVRAGRARVATGDAMADRYDLAVTALADAGFQHYELSNWARADGHQARLGTGATPALACRHNLLYWRNQEYWAGGPGGHGCWSGRRWHVVRAPRRYVAECLAGRPVLAGEEDIEPAMAMAETAFLALRLAEGLSVPGFAARHGRSVDEVYGPLVRRLLASGDLLYLGDRLVVRPDRWYTLDAIAAEFLPD